MREPDTTASRKGIEGYVKKSNKKHSSNTIHSQEIIKKIEQMIITEFYR